MNYRMSLENLYFASPVTSLYEGDDGDGGGAAIVTDPAVQAAVAAAAAAQTGTGLAGTDPNAAVNVDPNARFDQDQLNKIVQDRLAKDRKKHEDKYKTLEKTHQDLLAGQALSHDEREKLEQSLEDLRKQHRTKDEQAKHEKNQLKESYESELQTYKESAERWEKQHKAHLIEISLLGAASEHDAFMPQQILSIVRDWTKLVDAVDENDKPTGKLTAMVDLPDIDADTGKAIITQRTPMEAIERLKELQPNLFKANVVSGVGGNSTTGGGTPGADGRIDQSELTTEQWMKLYKEDRTKLGLRGNTRR